MNPNAAIKKALSSNRVKSTIADLGDIDFSILSENNPFDAAPAVRSEFNEASAGWKKYRPTQREVETVVTQPTTGATMRTIREAIDAMSNATPGRIGMGGYGNQLPSPTYTPKKIPQNDNTWDADELFEGAGVKVLSEPNFAQRLSGIPSARSASTKEDFLNEALSYQKAQRLMGWNPGNYTNQQVGIETTMVNPVVVANATGDAQKNELMAQIGLMLRRKLAEAPAGSPQRILGDPSTYVEPVAKPASKPGASLGSMEDVLAGALEGKTEYLKVVAGDEILLAEFQKRGGKFNSNAAPPVLRNTQKSSSFKSPNSYEEFGVPVAERESVNPYGVVYGIQQQPTPDIPFYRRPAVMYGGLGLAGLGGAALAYNAFSAPPEEEPQPVYQAPAYGQMPRSFR